MSDEELALETAREFIGAHEATMDAYQQRAFEKGVALVVALLTRVRLEGQLEIARKWHSLTKHRAGTYECCRLVTALEREQAAGGSAAAKEGE